MKRIRLIGLAVVAVFALSAVAAASASAFEFFEAETYPVTIKGKNKPGSLHKFKVDSGESTCESASFESGAYSARTNEVKVKPTYTGCNFIPIGKTGETTTVTTTGCEYGLNITGTVKVECGSGHIIVKAATCEVTVGSQTIPGTAVTYKNVGTGTAREVEVTSTAKGIKYQEHGCPLTKEVEPKDGIYEGVVFSQGFTGFENETKEGVFVK